MMVALYIASMVLSFWLGGRYVGFEAFKQGFMAGLKHHDEIKEAHARFVKAMGER